MSGCAALTADGEPCKGVAIRGYELCAAHHPDYRERRRRGASKGGRRGGRGRGSSEIGAIKDQLRELVALVRAGEIDRGDAVAAGQLLNTYIRALESERKGRLEDRELLSIDEVRYLLEGYADALKKHVTDPKVLQRISQDIKALPPPGNR